MDTMPVSLSILAVCSVVQLGFFIYDRVQHTRILRDIARRPSSTGYSYTTLLLVGFGCYLLGLFINRVIHGFLD